MISEARASLNFGPGQGVAGFTASSFKKRVGSLQITDGFEVASYTKPCALHRWAMRLVFGWKWQDA
ncbi:hypothetical protein LDO31_03000 [Luteimonas sp. XNQY3]|nr:hypothetical protein [Luteimonas sp. XNQY3]MCD9005215.1 hypothetical protein [Luteimonas sp. XNQY3]